MARTKKCSRRFTPSITSATSRSTRPRTVSGAKSKSRSSGRTSGCALEKATSPRSKSLSKPWRLSLFGPGRTFLPVVRSEIRATADMPSVYDRFHLVSDFELRGDQVHAVPELVDGLNRGDKHQVLLGVTGSGKTYTMAQTIARVNRPTLVMAH